jgi:hypothetical protein
MIISSITRLAGAGRDLLVPLLLAVLIAGCGASSEVPQPKPVALVISDASSSFRAFAPDCVPDFETVAAAVAVRRGDLYGGAFVTGNPLGQPFTVEAHFGAPPPPSIAGNGDLEAANRKRQAAALRPALEKMVRTSTPTGGSPVFTSLLRVASFRQQRASGRPLWAVICSDLANVGDGIDVRKPISDGEVHTIVRRWSERLRGLAGTDLYVTGAGRLHRGSRSRPDSIRQVERSIRQIARRVGARVLLIDTQLGSVFPLP